MNVERFLHCPTLEDLRNALNDMHEQGHNLKEIKWNGFDDEAIYIQGPNMPVSGFYP